MRLANILSLTTAALLSVLLLSPAAAATGPVAKVLRQGPDGFSLRIEIPEVQQEIVDLPEGGSYLRVTLPGFGQGGTEDAGLPDLPHRGFPFGLPEDATAVLRFRVIDSQTFSGLAPIPVPTRRFVPGDPFPQEDDRYDPASGAYASSALTPAEIVSLGSTAGWRHQRVQTIVVSPVQAAPATGEYRVARVIEVDVEFVRDSRAAKGIALVPAGPDAPGWDELIDGVLVNGTSAQSFRMRAAPATVASTITPGQSYVRVRFGSTGLARLSYAQLAAGGFPADVPLAQVRVEERGYDKTKADPFTVVNLPRIVEDNNSNGVFDAGDFVVFYGFNYRDRYDNDLFYDERYSYFHTYWLTASPEGGSDYAEVDGYPAGDGYTPVTSFPQSDHYEEDLYYINNPPDDGGYFLPIRSSFYWLGPSKTNEYTRVYTYDFDPQGSFSIRALWQGIFATSYYVNHLVSLKINSCQLLTDGSFFSQDDFDYRSGSRPSTGCLSLGSNTVYITGRTSVITTSTGAAFDWFDLTYDRLVKARGNQLVFNSGDRTGLLEFAVTGFTSPDVVVVEITDPAAPVRMRAQVAEEGGTYTAKIRVSVGGTRRKFAAFVPASLNGLPATTRVPGADLGAQAIAAGLPRDLLAEGNGSDYILITHPSFKDAWGALVAHREAQGHRVFVCDVLEIYDQFAGGDKTPWAIQRFLAQAFRTWNPAPTYVLLGGDASEDYRATSVDENNRLSSDPDFVPTMMHFASVPGPEGKELAGTDNWFVAALRPTDNPLDVYPEMHIGRLPVGSVEEVNNVVDKIVAYEDWKPEDTWRNRAIIIADDQYSTSIYPGQNYCFKPEENKFLNASQAAIDSIRVLGRLPNFDCRLFPLAAYLDTVATLNRHPGPSDCPLLPGLNEATSYARSKVTPLMLQELSQGALAWEFHGHANKNLMTTEALFEHQPKMTTRDFDKLNNVGKPFIFFGYACHLNEFEHAREKTFGDGMGEVLVLAGNRRGAIASIASTGYEWLDITPDAQRYTSRALFWNLPRDPATGRPRRILGEAMTRAWAACALESGDKSNWREMFRTYVTLGDPALRVDIAGPGFQVDVNGETVTDGTPLLAASFSDTLQINAVVSDDVDVSTIRVLDGETELPPERLTIVKPGSRDDGAQSYQVAFATTLRLGSYDISVVARDWTGRETRFVLPVSLDIVALADGKRLERDCSSVVDLAAVMRFEVDSPVPLGEENFQVAVDDTVMTAISAPVDETRRNWTVEVNRVWGTGQHDIVLRIRDEAGGEVSFSRCFAVSSGETQLLSTYFYPNPCEGKDGALYYTLNQSVKRARLNVYAVSGRRVRRDDLPTSVGQNAFVWDLKDEAGDRVANGVYLFLLDLEGYDGRKIRRLERVAVTR